MVISDIFTYFEGQAVQLNRVLCVASDLCDFNELTGEHLWEQLSRDKIFGRNVIRDLYFGGRKGYVPRLVVDTYRNIINQAPQDIQKELNRLFEQRINELAWTDALAEYFEQRCSYQGSWSIQKVQDYSIGAGVYCLSFDLIDAGRTVDLFLKREFKEGFTLKHESFYHGLQVYLINKDKRHPQPFYYAQNQGTALSIAKRFPGVSSELFFSQWLTQDTEAQSRVIHNLLLCLGEHAALGDVFGRNDRHLGNSHVAWDSGSDAFLWNDRDKHDFCLDIRQSQQLWMIDFDIQYLLKRDNYDWMLEDIRQGLSEMNLFTVLWPHFLYESNDEELLKVIDVFQQAYEGLLQQMCREEALDWIDQWAQNIYGTSEVRSLRHSLSDQIDYLCSASWKKSHYRALLVDYRYRYTIKLILQDRLDQGKLAGEFLRYVVAPELRGAALHLEAFRGVSGHSFLDQASLQERMSWEVLEGELEVFLGQECWLEVQRKKQGFEEQFARMF